jgi:hypothetical protein
VVLSGAAVTYYWCVDSRAFLRRLVALTVAAVGVSMLAACGATQHRTGGSEPGTLRVRQVSVPGSLYVEGSYSYVRVEQDGHEIAKVRLTNAPTPRATIRLGPGSYRLVSFQRACDGNCGILDAPSDQCDLAVDVSANQVVSATVRLSPGKGCTIETTDAGA